MPRRGGGSLGGPSGADRLLIDRGGGISAVACVVPELDRNAEKDTGIRNVVLEKDLMCSGEAGASQSWVRACNRVRRAVGSICSSPRMKLPHTTTHHSWSHGVDEAVE